MVIEQVRTGNVYEEQQNITNYFVEQHHQRYMDEPVELLQDFVMILITKPMLKKVCILMYFLFCFLICKNPTTRNRLSIF